MKDAIGTRSEGAEVAGPAGDQLCFDKQVEPTMMDDESRPNSNALVVKRERERERESNRNAIDDDDGELKSRWIDCRQTIDRSRVKGAKARNNAFGAK
jgi:hypothetical protein